MSNLIIGAAFLDLVGIYCCIFGYMMLLYIGNTRIFFRLYGGLLAESAPTAFTQPEATFVTSGKADAAHIFHTAQKESCDYVNRYITLPPYRRRQLYEQMHRRSDREPHSVDRKDFEYSPDRLEYHGLCFEEEILEEPD